MFEIIELTAVVTAAVYGILQARSARMDVLGVFTVAFATAFGGGTLRDLFLDRHPLFWIAKPHYTMIVFAMAVVSCLFRRLPVAYKKLLYLPDALGLGLFSVVGVQYALEQKTGYFIAALMGVITGTFGGVISDILCVRVPALFKSAPLYATVSFAGCWVFLLLLHFQVAHNVAALVGIAAIVLFRGIALYWNLCLPEMRDD